MQKPKFDFHWRLYIYIYLEQKSCSSLQGGSWGKPGADRFRRRARPEKKLGWWAGRSCGVDIRGEEQRRSTAAKCYQPQLKGASKQSCYETCIGIRCYQPAWMGEGDQGAEGAGQGKRVMQKRKQSQIAGDAKGTSWSTKIIHLGRNGWSGNTWRSQCRTDEKVFQKYILAENQWYQVCSEVVDQNTGLQCHMTLH